MDKIEKQLLQTVEQTIFKYDLLEKNGHVAVAVSGGKDSVTSLILLDKLGYKTKPFIVDLGYLSFNSQRVMQIVQSLQLSNSDNPVILKVRHQKFLNTLQNKEKHDILNRLVRLDKGGNDYTPCTDCYNTKLSALKYIDATLNDSTTGLIKRQVFSGKNPIVFGHHSNDSIASFLKCTFTYLYYQMYTKPYGISYQRRKMRHLISSLEQNELSLLTDSLVKKGKANTDEPPREFTLNGLEIVRPLFEVAEKDIINFKKMMVFPTEASGCSHSIAIQNQTFRELIHINFTKREKESPSLRFKFLELIKQTLDKKGMLKNQRVRNKRDEWYPGFKDFILKY